MSLKAALLHFKFENFASLPVNRNTSRTASVDLGSGGRKSFTMDLNPRSMHLYLDGANTPFDGKYCTMIRNSVGDIVVERDFDESYNLPNIMKRSDIVDDGKNI